MQISYPIFWFPPLLAALPIAIGMTTIWLLVGAVLCGFELMLPTAFVAMMMGVSAFVMAGLSLVLPHAGLQIFLWMGLSSLLVFKGRKFLEPQHKRDPLEGDKEAETLTEILPGKAGRVLYEGNSWQARCADEDMTIAPQQKVYVVSQKGTTLFVMPQNILHS